MSVRCIAWVFHESRSTGSERLVLLTIADSCNDEGECWPSIQTIAAKARVSESTARRSVRGLEAMGELVVVAGGATEAAERAGQRKPRGDRVTNAYLMTFQATGGQSDSGKNHAGSLRIVK